MLLTFSTSVIGGQAALIDRVCEAVAGLDLDAVLTLGPAVDRDAVSVPNGVEVLDFADHDSLMPDSAVVVGHGGLGTVLRALAQIAPLGRGPEQVASYRRLVKPSGWLALEEWDLGSWHFNPPAPAADRLIRLISEIFGALGGEAGRGLPELLRGIGIEEPELEAHVIALKPRHPIRVCRFSSASRSSRACSRS